LGIYTLFAAVSGCEVLAIEPDAQNFALLQANLRLNSARISGSVRSYPFTLHREWSISELHVSSAEWGSAMNAFGIALDYKGQSFDPLFRQGAIGISLDELLESLGFVATHMKIDVDGNEGEVLAGARRTLRSPKLQSLLIELDERRLDYSSCISEISLAGFEIIRKTPSTLNWSDEAQTFNHIFARPK